MPKTPLQVLIEVRDLFQDRKKWTRAAYARSRDGRECDPRSRDAVCWCLTGAIKMKAENSSQMSWENQSWETRELLRPFTNHHALAYVNDCDGYDAVLQLLDKAIAHVQN